MKKITKKNLRNTHLRFNRGDGVYHRDYGVGEISCFWGEWDADEERYGCKFDSGAWQVCSSLELESRPSRKTVSIVDANPKSKEAKEAYYKSLDSLRKRV